MIALALIGAAIAGYLALYQEGAIGHVWDPLFGPGSERVVGSAVARALPIPDAALGVAAYLLDALTDAIGPATRWRTMPWIVLVFGAIVAGLVVVALGLVLAQALVVHAGCTLCLASAAISLATGVVARDEILAALGAVRRARAAGRTLGQALRGEAPDRGVAA